MRYILNLLLANRTGFSNSLGGLHYHTNWRSGFDLCPWKWGSCFHRLHRTEYIFCVWFFVLSDPMRVDNTGIHFLEYLYNRVFRYERASLLMILWCVFVIGREALRMFLQCCRCGWFELIDRIPFPKCVARDIVACPKHHTAVWISSLVFIDFIFCGTTVYEHVEVTPLIEQ